MLVLVTRFPTLQLVDQIWRRLSKIEKLLTRSLSEKRWGDYRRRLGNRFRDLQPRSQGLSSLPPLSLNDNGGREERPWERG